MRHSPSPRWQLTVRALWIAATALLLGTASPLPAQLISPGRLAQPHASLEGMNNCTQCHTLGQRGITNTKCLQCHTTLRDRIQADDGLHATFGNRSCAACHKDHFGTEFDMVRFDTAGFDHRKTGYELRLSHREEGCRSCHKPTLLVDADVRTYTARHRTASRTFLGLGTNCTDCHRTDNAHGNQFGPRGCAACHNEDVWEKAPRFNHDSARYVLTGRHRTAECASCHKEVAVPGAAEPVTRYAGLRFQTCTTCHADFHRGTMPPRCEQCHSTEGWRLLRNRSGFESGFDHSRTDFDLRGAHATLTCASCHDPRRAATATIHMTWPSTERGASYPAPDAASCTSCHVDAHEGTFAAIGGRTDCTSCHSESQWSPSAYDLARHNRETFALTGAHVTVACNECHKPARVGGPPQFKLPAQDCATCHKTNDPHNGQFANRACTDCHVTETFRIASFDHARTRYPLDGAHRDVACAKCHVETTDATGTRYIKYKPLSTSCRACHDQSTSSRE